MILAKMEKTYNSIALDCRSNLLGSGRDVERGFCLQTMLQSLLGDICASTHVLVGAIGAGTNQADLDFVWPVVLLCCFACYVYIFITILITTEINEADLFSKSFRAL